MTRSIARKLAADTVAISIGIGSGFKTAIASKIVERPADSDPPSPSL
jgi:protein-L-isoaspartate O-methyltransferase